MDTAIIDVLIVSVALEPKPTRQPPKASSIAEKMNLHQRQDETKSTRHKTKGKNYFGKAGDNKNRIFNGGGISTTVGKC